MYIVTPDNFHTIHRVNGQAKAIKLAEEIQGEVYLPSDGKNTLLYRHGDE